MSLINGDKARDNRRHNKLVKMREKREALQAQLAGAQKKNGQFHITESIDYLGSFRFKSNGVNIAAKPPRRSIFTGISLVLSSDPVE